DSWFTFFNPDVGNADYHVAGTPVLDSGAPTAIVKGTGDGRVDSYRITITPEMLSRNSLNAITSALQDPTHDYYTDARVTLNGTSYTGDVWTVEIGGKNYQYTMLASDQGLGDIVAGLQAVIAAQEP